MLPLWLGWNKNGTVQYWGWGDVSCCILKLKIIRGGTAAQDVTIPLS
jgi:hypothetical protein